MIVAMYRKCAPLLHSRNQADIQGYESKVTNKISKFDFRVQLLEFVAANIIEIAQLMGQIDYITLHIYPKEKTKIGLSNFGWHRYIFMFVSYP